jgi:cytoskeletal protein CcmA (bactofilin family)
MWRSIPLSELRVLTAHKSIPPPRPSRHANGTASRLDNDLSFFGQGLKAGCRGILQIDCEIRADLEATKIIVDRNGRVTGTVTADRVTVRGRVSGTIHADTVILEASSEVHGDIRHRSLAIDEGARFVGRSSPAPVAAVAAMTIGEIPTEQHAPAGIG